MAKLTIKNSINPQEIDFSCTALEGKTGVITSTDTVEWYFTTGELAASVTVGRILEWMEENGYNEGEEQEVCINDSPFEKMYKSEIQMVKEHSDVDYFDYNFETVTAEFFMSVYANTEVEYAA